MAAQHASIYRLCCLAGLLTAVPGYAQEVYRWVDENGVVNFSDTAPAAPAAAVDILALENPEPAGQDPEEDIYDVAGQAERMQALREEMAREREARRERQRNSAQQPAAQPSESVRYGYPYTYPAYPRPPMKPPARPPGKPTPEPYETSTLRPPGQAGNADTP